VTDAERAILNDYVALFDTDVGRRVLENLKHRAGFYLTRVMRGAPIDPTRLVWYEAQRAFVLETVKRAEFDFSKEVAPEKENE